MIKYYGRSMKQIDSLTAKDKKKCRELIEEARKFWMAIAYKHKWLEKCLAKNKGKFHVQVWFNLKDKTANDSIYVTREAKSDVVVIERGPRKKDF
jgi:hypothetical protein